MTIGSTSGDQFSEYRREVAAAGGAYVWMWLPGDHDPTPVGRVQVTGVVDNVPTLSFTYAARYRDRAAAMSLYTPELPLVAGTFDPQRPVSRSREPLPLASCLRDAAPDAWGRRVINLQVGSQPDLELSELTYLLLSGSDRIGALDFQLSATSYVPRGEVVSLEQLLEAAERTEAGEQLPPELLAAARHGTSIGGARPKALLVTDEGRQLIAKFASSTDTRPVVKAEAACMRLARTVGIDVPTVELVGVDGRDVALVERFDRPVTGGRRHMLSGLTLLGLGEFGYRSAHYGDLAELMVTSFDDAPTALEQLYRRLTFNVCIGNNDDHLRNIAAFYDAEKLTLAPAYDLTPQPRSTRVSTQAIAIRADGARASQLAVVRAAAPEFRLSPGQAAAIVDDVVSGVRDGFATAADSVGMTAAEIATFDGREILNPYIFYDEA